MMLNYDAPLYRPPSEAKSLIFQVTLGCSFNECSFCDMYRSKEYSERSWEEVKSEIDLMAKTLPDTTRIFLADGDALNLSTDYMVQIVEYIYQKFPNLERVSCLCNANESSQKNSRGIKHDEQSWTQQTIPWNRNWKRHNTKKSYKRCYSKYNDQVV